MFGGKSDNPFNPDVIGHTLPPLSIIPQARKIQKPEVQGQPPRMCNSLLVVSTNRSSDDPPEGKHSRKIHEYPTTLLQCALRILCFKTK
ncbi:hypothetical protein MTP99_008715 [Tenebrio molitor]|jgi:Na+-translocating ferredoxin:NAD+ oxidoreductase RnfD subunit|nr:hypothetical protein MTP99_008715 [Tenebrio molitor]